MKIEKTGLVYETAKIEWRALQRFYAQGNVMHVASKLDLVRVATAFLHDDVAAVGAWQAAGQVRKVDDAQALQWFESDAQVWAVTVAPFVLVQSIHSKN
ncbi:MAG: DUF2288 domain-containing protein [Gammaproteobacteria bacterium]|nr:DUF2288 domain-containing protein [Gammaproteobacteria bacterium]NNC98355.1 DUF2288 domain-containing protein [Gammaproteobacteria bacterium]NNM13742.1 DUF2288 domain-containing protein [Gammaproteobacteria bacterium]